MPEETPRPRIDRAAKACSNCRERKVRCSGGNRCRDCQRLGKECVYPPSKRRRLKRTKHRQQPLQDRQTGKSRRPNSRISPPSVIVVEDEIITPRVRCSLGSPCPPTHPIGAFTSEVEQEYVQYVTTDSSGSRKFTSGYERAIRETIRSPPSQDTHGRNSTVDPHREDCSQVWSWKSIYSETGSKWLSKTTGSEDFVDVVRQFGKDSSHETLLDESLLINANPPEVTETIAWQYVDAFFQNCWEADIGIIDRTAFEARLRNQLHSPTSKGDSAWFALKHTVFAAGLRSLLAKDPSVPFATAQAKADQFFGRALSVFTNLLLLPRPPCLMSVRALSLMACYVEGIGSPAFKHFICWNAVHLAQSQKLHRFEGPDDASLPGSVARNRLWWTLYALEKNRISWTNRPSAIDDSGISAQVPSAGPSDSNAHWQTINTSTEVVKMHSQIWHLLSAKAASTKFEELAAAVMSFDTRLRELLSGLPPDLKLDSIARPSCSSRSLIQAMYPHFKIYGSLITLHSYFFYPWTASRFDLNKDDVAVTAQISYSSSTAAEAARKILLALRLIYVDGATPSWLAYDYPINAAINLFIYVLKYPTLPSTVADLGLLDMCAGHFGYLNYLTSSSQESTSLAREAANIAHKVVKANKALSKPSLCPSAYEEQEVNYSVDMPDVLSIPSDDVGLESTAPMDLNRLDANILYASSGTEDIDLSFFQIDNFVDTAPSEGPCPSTPLDVAGPTFLSI